MAVSCIIGGWENFSGRGAVVPLSPTPMVIHKLLAVMLLSTKFTGCDKTITTKKCNFSMCVFCAVNTYGCKLSYL